MGNASENILKGLQTVISEERLSSYLGYCGGNLEKTIAVYSWNIELSQSLYPILNLLEVVLRNSINYGLSKIIGSENWLEDIQLYPKERELVNKAKSKIQRENKEMSNGKVVSELSFGFWTSLFDVRYEKHQIIWPRILNYIFPNIPRKNKTRKYLSKEINEIRKLSILLLNMISP